MKSIKALKYFLLISGLAISFQACSEDTIDDTGLGTITGTVVEEVTNEPIENARISTNPASSTVFTDENGEFVIQNIPVEDYSVEARKEGWQTQFEGAAVMGNATVNVIFEMQTETSNNKRPTAPEGLAPLDTAEGIATTTEFSWSSADPDNDNLLYSLEIRNDKNDEIFFFEEISDTTYTVEGLDYNTKYFWQVTATDEVNPEVLSPLFSFRTMEVPDNRILFTRLVNGNNVIFATNEEGEKFQLTNSDSNSFRPRKNNASNRVAFLRTVGGQTHLFTMNPDGTQQRQVTSEIPVNGFNMAQMDFAWADNGASLLYPNFDKLYKIETSGGGSELVYQEQSGDFITEVAISEASNTIGLITNNSMGYDADIFTIDMEGSIKEIILRNVEGAVGGLDFSVEGDLLLYSHDASGFESNSYRRLDSRLFIYDLTSGETTDISLEKEAGTNDLDPRFSPNEAEVIFVNSSNDEISQKDIFRIKLRDFQDEEERRNLLVENAAMPDWE